VSGIVLRSGNVPRGLDDVAPRSQEEGNRISATRDVNSSSQNDFAATTTPSSSLAKGKKKATSLSEPAALAHNACVLKELQWRARTTIRSDAGGSEVWPQLVEKIGSSSAYAPRPQDRRERGASARFRRHLGVGGRGPVKVAPQVGLEPTRLRFAFHDASDAKLRRGLAVARLTTLRAKAGNPPVGSLCESSFVANPREGGRDLVGIGSSGRTRTYNPPVNSRIQFVLPRVAAGCRELLDGAYLPRRQEVATCRTEPHVAARCRELWRPKGKNKATCVQMRIMFTCSEQLGIMNAWPERRHAPPTMPPSPAGFPRRVCQTRVRANPSAFAGAAPRDRSNSTCMKSRTSRRVTCTSSSTG